MANLHEGRQDSLTTDEGYAFQASIKYGPRQEGMVNIRVTDPKELEAWLNVAEQVAPTLNDLITVYNPPKDLEEGISNLRGGGIDGEVYEGKVCQHGPMTYKTGQGAKGPWSAWMCPAPQGAYDKCQPVDAKTGRPWPKR